MCVDMGVRTCRYYYQKVKMWQRVGGLKREEV